MQDRATFTQSELTRVLKAAKAAGFDVQIEPGRVRLMTQGSANDDDDVAAELARNFRAKR